MDLQLATKIFYQVNIYVPIYLNDKSVQLWKYLYQFCCLQLT